MRDCSSSWSVAVTLEETYHTFSYSPLADDTGVVSGMLCVVTEETERIIGERHLKTLRDLGARTTLAKTVTEACRIVVTTLNENTADFPFSLLYLTDPDGRTAYLCELSQLPRGTKASPELIDLTTMPSIHAWPLAEAVAQDGPVHILDVRTRFDSLPGGPWNAPPTEAIVLPLRQREPGTNLVVPGRGYQLVPRLRRLLPWFLRACRGSGRGGHFERERLRGRAEAGRSPCRDWTGPRRPSSRTSAMNSARR